MSDHPYEESAPDAGLSTRRATTADGRAALRHEASLLQMVRHPGVTELVRITDEDETTVLTTRSGSDQTLADWDGSERGWVDTAVIAGVLAALATTCADLHGLGVAHGRIEPQRVAISGTGQPILTGFEAAGPIGSIAAPADPPLPPFCDPAAGPDRPLQPTVDVYGLGALLEHLLERHPPSSGDTHRGGRRKLRRLARTATAESPDRRPDAAGLASAILEAAPTAHLPGDTASPVPHPPSPGSIPLRLERPTADLSPPPTGRGTRRAAVAAAATLALVGGLLALGRNRPAATSETARVSKPAATTQSTSVRATAVPATAGSVVAATTLQPVTSPPTTVADVPPADSTAVPFTTPPIEPQPITEPAYVVFDGVRYRIDGGERRFAVGDWNCDGSATLTTLDPSTGALTFFETWPETGSTLATSADHRPGAIDLRTDHVGDCDQLTIVHADGVDTYEGTGDSS